LEDPEFPADKIFSINDRHIEKKVDANELVRFLGVHWSLNGKLKPTIDRAYRTMNSALNLLRRKHAPGKIAIYLINSVIIPRLSYHLQFAPVPKTTMENINAQLRKLARFKCNLPRSSPNAILYDDDFDIKLMDFEVFHNARMINDTMITLNRPKEDITKRVLENMLQKISKKASGPEDLLTRTMETKLKYAHYITYLSYQMAKWKLSLRVHQEPRNILYYIEDEEYVKFLDIWHRLQNIKSGIALKVDFWITETYEETKTHNEIMKSLWNKPPNYMSEHEEWYESVIRKVALIPEESLFNINDRYFVKKEIRAIFKDDVIGIVQELPIENKELNIWTDGSYTQSNTNSEQKLGSAAIIIDSRLDQSERYVQEVIQSKPSTNNASSTRAELWAIFKALEKLKPTNTIKILTDSQNAISQITKTLNTTNLRYIFKMENYGIILSIREQMKKFITTPTFQWVKAHVNTPLNELADKKAKQAAADPNMHNELPPITKSKHVRLLYHNNQLTESYPTKVLKKIRQTEHATETNDRIRRVWDDQANEIDTKLSIKITGTGMVKLNAFDAANTNEKAFRIKTINRLLPTLDKVQHYYGLINDATCKRCKKDIETLEHLWECEKSYEKLPEMKEKFREILETRINDSTDYSKMRDKKPPTTKLYQILPIEQEDFLKSTLAKGVVEKSVYDQLKENNQDIEQFKQWFIYAMDCWLSVFYKIVWRHRNDLSIPKDIKKIMKSRQKQNNERKRKLKLDYDPNDIKEIKNKRITKKKTKRGLKEEIEYLIQYWNTNEPVWEISTNLVKHAKLIKEYENNLKKLEDENIELDGNITLQPIQELSPEVKRRRITNILRRKRPKKRIITLEIPKDTEQEEDPEEKEAKRIQPHRETRKRRQTPITKEELDWEIKKRRRKRE
jgi:ribonuclease HI